MGLQVHKLAFQFHVAGGTKLVLSPLLSTNVSVVARERLQLFWALRG